MNLKYFILISLTCALMFQPPLHLSKRSPKKGKTPVVISKDLEFTDQVFKEIVSSTPLETKITSFLPSASVSKSIDLEKNTEAPSPSPVSPINREASNVFPKLPDETNKTLLIVLVAVASVILLLTIVFVFYRIRINNLKSKDEWNCIKKSESRLTDSFQVVPTLEFLPMYEPEYHSQFSNITMHDDNLVDVRSIVPPQSICS